MYITSYSIRIVLLSRYVNIYDTMAPMSYSYLGEMQGAIQIANRAVVSSGVWRWRSGELVAVDDIVIWVKCREQWTPGGDCFGGAAFFELQAPCFLQRPTHHWGFSLLFLCCFRHSWLSFLSSSPGGSNLLFLCIFEVLFGAWIIQSSVTKTLLYSCVAWWCWRSLLSIRYSHGVARTNPTVWVFRWFAIIPSCECW